MSTPHETTLSDRDLDTSAQMMEYARQLMQSLEQGQSLEAMKIIHDLNKFRDQRLFAEVGRLTRTLHDAIVNFHLDGEMQAIDEQDEQEMSRMRDASDRLNYVITMTDRAANKTMDLLETTLPVLERLHLNARELRPQWQKLMRREMQASEFRELYGRIDAFLASAAQDAHDLKSLHNDIVVAQDYQDLTGQVIKRVISLVKEVEDSLVKLVKMASQVDSIAGISHQQPLRELSARDRPAGPVVNPEVAKDSVSGQDEVDDLLSSLGF